MKRLILFSIMMLAISFGLQAMTVTQIEIPAPIKDLLVEWLSQHAVSVGSLAALTLAITEFVKAKVLNADASKWVKILTSIGIGLGLTALGQALQVGMFEGMTWAGALFTGLTIVSGLNVSYLYGKAGLQALGALPAKK